MFNVSRALWPIASITTSAGIEPPAYHAAHLAVGQVQVLDTAVEADLAAERFDAPPQGLDDGRQSIAAQVRSIIIKDGWLPLALGEQFEHPANIRPRRAAGEFAVAEGPRPAFAEKIVALRIEGAAAVEGLHVADALMNGRAALEDERHVAVLGQKETGREPGRAGTDDDGAMPQRRRAGRRRHDRGFLVAIDDDLTDGPLAAQTAAVFVFRREGNLDGVDETQVLFDARIEALAKDAPGPHVVGRAAAAPWTAAARETLRVHRVPSVNWRCEWP